MAMPQVLRGGIINNPTSRVMPMPVPSQASANQEVEGWETLGDTLDALWTSAPPKAQTSTPMASNMRSIPAEPFIQTSGSRLVGVDNVAQASAAAAGRSARVDAQLSAVMRSTHADVSAQAQTQMRSAETVTQTRYAQPVKSYPAGQGSYTGVGGQGSYPGTGGHSQTGSYTGPGRVQSEYISSSSTSGQRLLNGSSSAHTGGTQAPTGRPLSREEMMREGWLAEKAAAATAAPATASTVPVKQARAAAAPMQVAATSASQIPVTPTKRASPPMASLYQDAPTAPVTVRPSAASHEPATIASSPMQQQFLQARLAEIAAAQEPVTIASAPNQQRLQARLAEIAAAQEPVTVTAAQETVTISAATSQATVLQAPVKSAAAASSQPSAIQTQPAAAAATASPVRTPVRTARPSAAVATPSAAPAAAKEKASTEAVARVPTSQELEQLRAEMQSRKNKRTSDKPEPEMQQSELSSNLSRKASTVPGDQASGTVDQLTRENALLESQLKEVVTVCGNLEAELANEKASKEAAQKRAADAEAQAQSQASNEVAMAMAAQGASQQELAYHKQRTSEAEAQLSDVLAMCKELQDRMQTKESQAKQDLEAAEVMNQKLAAHNASSQGLIEQLQRELQNSKAMVDALTVQLEGEGSAKQQLQEQLNSAELQVRAAANNEVHTATMELSRMQSRNAELEMQLREAVAKHGQAEAKLAAQAVEMAEVRGMLSAAETQAQFATSKAEAQATSESEVEVKSTKLKLQIANLESQLQTENQSSAGLKFQISDLESQLQRQAADHKVRILDLETQLLRHVQANADLKSSQLQSATPDVADLKYVSDLENQLQRQVEASVGHKAQISDLSSQLQRATATAAVEAAAVLELRREKADSEKQLQELQSGHMTLQQQLEALGGENTAHRQRIESLTSQLQQEATSRPSAPSSPASPSRMEHEFRRQQSREVDLEAQLLDAKERNKDIEAKLVSQEQRTTEILKQLAAAEQQARQASFSKRDGSSSQNILPDTVAGWLPNLLQRQKTGGSALSDGAVASLFEAVAGNDSDVLKAALSNLDKPVETVLAARNDAGQTLLHVSLSKGSVEAAKFILEQGSKWAANHKYLYELQGELLERQMSTFVNGEDKIGCSPLQALCQRAEVAKEEEAVIIGLMEAAADPMSRDSMGVTPFIECARSGNTSIMRLLLQITRGAVLLDKDSQSRSALHWAVTANKKDIVEILLKVKAEVDVADIEGNTALQIATSAGYEDIKKILEEGVVDSDDDDDDDEGDNADGEEGKEKSGKGGSKGNGKEFRRMKRPDGDMDDFVGDFDDMDEFGSGSKSRDQGGSSPFARGRVGPGGVLRPEGFPDPDDFSIDADELPPELLMAAMSQGLMGDDFEDAGSPLGGSPFGGVRYGTDAVRASEPGS